MFSLVLRRKVILLSLGFDSVHGLGIDSKSVETDSSLNFIEESGIIFGFFLGEVFMSTSY